VLRASTCSVDFLPGMAAQARGAERRVEGTSMAQGRPPARSTPIVGEPAAAVVC
jgi:hypothetical protein